MTIENITPHNGLDIRPQGTTSKNRGLMSQIRMQQPGNHLPEDTSKMENSLLLVEASILQIIIPQLVIPMLERFLRNWCCPKIHDSKDEKSKIVRSKISFWEIIFQVPNSMSQRTNPYPKSISQRMNPDLGAVDC
jgi:hypothetical protein